MDGLSSSILPPIDAQGSVFLRGRSGYTIRMPQTIALVSSSLRLRRIPVPSCATWLAANAKIQLAMKRILPWKWHEKLVANFLKID
jgi:hypothetical protein